jgi:hypothetical protein
LRLIHYLLRRRPTLHFPKDIDKLHNLPFEKHASNTKRIKVRFDLIEERRAVLSATLGSPVWDG